MIKEFQTFEELYHKSKLNILGFWAISTCIIKSMFFFMKEKLS